MGEFEVIKEKPQQNQNQQNQDQKMVKSLKTATIILAMVVAIIGGALIYFMVQNKEGAQQLQTEMTAKELLISDLEELRVQYDTLRSDNDTLNYQLSVEREKIDGLMERIKNTEATNRARIREYERELGTLRDVMRNYVVQIDSLNTLNQQLRAQTALARSEVQEERKKYETLVQKTDDLQDKVIKGAAIKIRDVNVIALNANDREVPRAGRTAKIRTCFTLVENVLAERGFHRLYIRIKGPDGILITHSNNNVFAVNGEQYIYSEMREVDYQGDDLEVCIFYGRANDSFTKGVYNVEIYNDGAIVGNGQLLLK